MTPLSIVSKKSSCRQGAYILGSFIDALTWDSAITKIDRWVEKAESRIVCICNVHSIVNAFRHKSFRNIINNADMATPDGMPIAWSLRIIGYSRQKRINGPDLMWELCKVAEQRIYPIYLYGSTDKTLNGLKKKLNYHFPRLKVAGVHSPPFSELNQKEDDFITQSINSSGAKIVLVGLGCPKQEKWMAAKRGKIKSVMIGVGAAFDFHAGNLKRAPIWMQNAGLEWCHRFFKDPKRLWKRYLLTNPIFIILVFIELFSKKKGKYNS